MTTIPAPTLPPLVVQSDPVAAKKALMPSIVVAQIMVVLFAFLAVYCAALGASSGDIGTGISFGLPILFSVLLLVYVLTQAATNLGIRLVAAPVLTIDASGLSSTIVQGAITVPWTSIESIAVRKRGRHRIVSFLLAPSTTPDTPGVVSTLPRAAFNQLVKKGFRLGSAGIDVPMQTVLDASAAFTQGRLTAR
jgi:hypothetical protein